jgi:septin family protein
MVFGTGKNGKSTMLNALLEDDLLPSGTTTCTGNSTEIGPVRNPAGKEIIRLHRAGDAADKWEEHELEPPGTSPRMKKEWVVDMTIDKIVVEHKNEIFRHNVKIFDVPGCAHYLLGSHATARAQTDNALRFISTG